MGDSPPIGLRGRLRGWNLPKLPSVPPAPITLVHAVREAQFRLHNPILREPGKFDLDDTVKALRNAWRDRNLQSLDRVHIRRAPYALFHGAGPHLGADPNFMKQYLSLVSRNGQRPSTVAALVHVFLSTYPSDAPTFGMLRSALQSFLEKSTAMRLYMWRGRCGKYDLLHTNGPTKLAQTITSDRGRPVEEILGDAGLTEGLVGGGFALATFDAFLTMEQNALTTAPSIGDVERIAAFAVAGGRLRYPTLRHRLAEVLLMPFVSGRPPDGVMAWVKDFLMKYLGHPRIQRGNWIRVSETAQQVFLRWLAEEALDDFFALFDETAKDEHWKYRKAFWSAYLDYITDAWVVLGRRANALARRRFAERAGSYGSLSGGESGHSVLMMRISELTITEWSHSGSCRIWIGGQNAPKLYQIEYTASHLTPTEWDSGKASFTRIVHSGSTAGTWQDKIAEILRKHCGIRVPKKEYMPSDWTDRSGSSWNQSWNWRR